MGASILPLGHFSNHCQSLYYHRQTQHLSCGRIHPNVFISNGLIVGLPLLLENAALSVAPQCILHKSTKTWDNELYQGLGHSPSFKMHEHSSHSNVQAINIEVQMHRLSSVIVPNQLDLLYAPW